MKKIFRILIVLNWATAIAGTIVYVTTRGSLPVELTPYLESRTRLGVTQFERAILWTETVLFMVSVVDSIGLFHFRRWARMLLVPLYVIATLLLPTNAVYIQTGWTRMLFSMSTVIGGMIIAMVFFSPLAAVFERVPDAEQVVEPERNQVVSHSQDVNA
jgi:hypothetical protein